MENLEKFLPLKTIKICSEDEPWFSTNLKKLERKMKREYVKHKQSKKWSFLNAAYLEKSEEEKAKYYENIVEDLKLSNPSQWYSKLRVKNQLFNHLMECLMQLSLKKLQINLAKYQISTNHYSQMIYALMESLTTSHTLTWNRSLSLRK